MSQNLINSEPPKLATVTTELREFLFLFTEITKSPITDNNCSDPTCGGGTI